MGTSFTRVRAVFVFTIGLVFGDPGAAHAQSAVWHWHNESSTTSGHKQLQPSGPDSAAAVLQTAALQGVGNGEKQIAQFNTAAGVPNTPGKIPSGASVSAIVWLRKTANLGTMYPRVKVRLNSSTGTSLCTATGATALTTTMTAYTLSCTTTAHVTVAASDRLYVWAGVNLTSGSSAGAFRGELGVEGTLEGSTNSRVTVPVALPAPSITSLAPGAGPVGQVVTITGTSFRDQQFGSTVKFHSNRTATVTNWTSTSITASVPASAVTGPVTVTVAGTASAGVTFQVGPVPLIAQLAPSTGLPGAIVVVTGSNFGAAKGSSTVKFNGVTAATTAWSATSITASVPAGATTGPVVVTVAGIASVGVVFTVPTLTAISVTPVALTVPLGGQQQYRAWGHYSDSVTREVTTSVTWASSDAEVATIAAGGLATVTGATGSSTLSATSGTVSGATDVTAAPAVFKLVASLRTKRVHHTATLLPNGTVLIAGGQDGNGLVTATAEVFDPATGRFVLTGSMLKRRHFHTATLLLDGTVLITGGLAYNPDEFHSTAEIYNPATGTFSSTGNMGSARYYHSATQLSDGRVLVDSGQWTFPPPSSRIYNPVTRVFSTTGAPTVFRSTHPAVPLVDGRVLFAGAYGEPTPGEGGSIADAEVFDPATGTYELTSSLGVARSLHSTTRLLDGRVLVVGGGNTCASQCTAEIYDAVGANRVPVDPLSVGRTGHATAVLDSGMALVVGGQTASAYTATAELFDPATNSFQSTGAMNVARQGHTATVLLDGTVLIVGGYGMLAAQSAEVFAPAPVTPVTLSVTPSNAAMEVGAAQGFTVIDQLGHTRSDAVWSSTAASVATIDPDTGIVTAVGAGTTTVMATIGAVSGSAQVTVFAGVLPIGTPRWTVGAPAGTTSRQLVSTSGGGRGGPSFVAANSSATETELQGLTADGQQQWRMWVPAPVRQVIPNASGGVIVTMYDGCAGGPLQMVSIDGPTGIWAWHAVGTPVCTPDAPQVAIRHDGAVAVVTPGNAAAFPNLMMLQGDTGAALGVPAVPQSTFTDFTGQPVPAYSRVGPPMVDADGTTHLLYEKRLLAYPPQVVDTGIWLLSVMPGQSSSTMQLSSTTANTNLFPGRIIPDGVGGLIVSWIDSPNVPAGQPPTQSTFRAARILAGGGVTPFDLPITPPLELLHPPNSALPTNPELVLGQDDRAFVSYGNSVASFQVSTGGASWTYAAESAIAMVAGAHDGGLVAKTQAPDAGDTILRFSAGGSVSSSTFGVSQISHVVRDIWTSPTLDSSAAGLLRGEPIDWATSGWFSPDQGKTYSAAGHLELINTSRGDPEQALIRGTFQLARAKLEEDLLLPNSGCAAWFNSALSGNDALFYLDQAVLVNDRFAHAEFKKGGSEQGGDTTSAFTGDKNADKSLVLGLDPLAGIHFNRRGAFFKKTSWKIGPYNSNTVHARLVIALHEFAHLLQDDELLISEARVLGFLRDGGDPKLSEQNTQLIVDKCRLAIERP